MKYSEENLDLWDVARIGEYPGSKSVEFVLGSVLLLHSLTQKDSIVAYAYEAVSFKKCEQWWERGVGRNLVVAFIPSTFWKAVWFCGEQ